MTSHYTLGAYIYVRVTFCKTISEIVSRRVDRNTTITYDWLMFVVYTFVTSDRTKKNSKISRLFAVWSLFVSNGELPLHLFRNDQRSIDWPFVSDVASHFWIHQKHASGFCRAFLFSRRMHGATDGLATFRLVSIKLIFKNPFRKFQENDTFRYVH